MHWTSAYTHITSLLTIDYKLQSHLNKLELKYCQHIKLNK